MCLSSYILTLSDVFNIGLLSAAVLGRRMGALLATSASRTAIMALNRAPDGADDGRGEPSSSLPSPSGRERPPKRRLVNIVDVEFKPADGRQRVVEVFGNFHTTRALIEKHMISTIVHNHNWRQSLSTSKRILSRGFDSSFPQSTYKSHIQIV